MQRPEYTGGIDVDGAGATRSLRARGRNADRARHGDRAADRILLAAGEECGESGRPTGFYSPGSLLRVTVDTAQPLAFGMPKDAIVFSSGGEAFEITLAPAYNHGDREIHSVASFAKKDLLASGWVSGERQVAGKSALVEARYGRGRVVLFGFRPQFRGQSYGAFKFLLNAIYLGSAQPL